MGDKPLSWVGSSLSDVRAFPEDARRIAGYQLRRVQAGLMPTDWKPIKAVGSGVNEIRIRTALQYRILYVAHIGEAVHVLHAFEKRTQKTRQADIDLARKRLAAVRASSAGKKGK
jgi:phage-related protein